MYKLAWNWLRYQPVCQLSRWINERLAGGGKRKPPAYAVTSNHDVQLVVDIP
jgi:hypothetical protein